MKNLIYILLLSTFVVLLSSCEMLNEDLVSEVSTDSHYTTPSGFEDAVNAAYAPLRNYYGNNVGAFLEEYGTDITQNAGHGGLRHYNWYTAALNSEDGIITSVWDSYYEAINITNAAINRAEGIQDMDETLKQTKIGEVHALRAFYYFTLVQHFGAVHLTTEETVGVEIEANRTAPVQVYEQIVSDLETAISNLPSDPSGQQFGRVTEPVAKMMLAHVLLTRGYQDFAAGDDFDRAATLAESVINDYTFQLVEDYERIFAQDNQQNSEIIWSIQYGTDPILNGPEDDDGNHSHVYYRPWYETYGGNGSGAGLVRSMEYGRPWIRFKMTPFALENYRPLDQDSRYDKSFQDIWNYNDAASLPTDQYPDVSVGDTAIYIDPDMTAQEVENNQDSTPYYLMSWATTHSATNINMFPNLKKHDDRQRSSVNEYGGTKDYFVYRLAEAYLFAAEARYNLGNLQQAADHINVVRRRAAWPGQESNMEIAAGDVTLDFILDERGREFYGESKRWTTLKRTGKLIERAADLYLGKLGDEPSRDPADLNTTAEEKYGNKGYKFLLRPIPATQITRTDGGYEQNPGY